MTHLLINAGSWSGHRPGANFASRVHQLRWPRIALTVVAYLLGSSLPAAVAVAHASALPNVVVFLTDDQGWGDLSVHGNRNLRTPSIDSLASDGALFESFFVCPVCSPTRAEFLTGRYHARGGVYSTSTGGERLDLDESTIAETFQAAGYATGAFGKWHNGTQYPYHPNGRGFDEYYGFCSGHWGDYFDPLLEKNGQLTKGDGYITDDLTDHAIQFIEAHRSRPFFCYIPYNTPHSPMQVPDRFYDRFDDVDVEMKNRDPKLEDPMMTRAALAMCENIDWNVGRVLQKLEDLKLDQNTIVVYFADNGPNSWRWNGGMKGRKGSTDEGGVRAPCLMRWPGRIAEGSRISRIAASIDLLPTLADLAGVSVAGDKPLDGTSLKPLLTGNAEGWSDRMIFSHWNKRVSVRTDRFRLDHQGKLFDMTRDPGQRHDISTQQSDVAAALTQAVSDWSAELLPGLRDDDRPFPVGYRQFPVTLLPPRDCQTVGEVRRSGRFPNCTYLLNWTSTDDLVSWDIEVETPGLYGVRIYYACPAADVGARFEIAQGDGRLEGKITEPHDPPIVGPEHDRVKRIEGFVKDFKPLDVGEMMLQKGRGALTIRATEIPGTQAMELRYLVLTLKQ